MSYTVIKVIRYTYDPIRHSRKTNIWFDTDKRVSREVYGCDTEYITDQLGCGVLCHGDSRGKTQ